MQIVLISVATLLALTILGLTIFLFIAKRKVYNISNFDLSTGLGVVEYHEEFGATPYVLKRKTDGTVSDEPFKVLEITDLHLQSKKPYILTLTILQRMLDEQKPDLTVVLGDLVVSTEGYALHKEVGRFFEERRQYWAFVLGNHDAEGLAVENARKKFVEAFSEFGYCLTRNEDEGIFGETNYILNVMGSKGKVMQSLVFFDSGFSRPDKKHYESYGFEYVDGDDFIKPNQIAWFNRRMAEIKEQNGNKNVNMQVFMHIPLPQFVDAYDKLKGTDKHIYGYKTENVCCAGVDSGLFDAIKNCGGKASVFAGHDHDNDYCIVYEGVKLVYCQSLAYLAYNSRRAKIYQLAYRLDKKNLCYFADGATVIMIKSDGSTDTVPVRNAFSEGILDGLEKYFEELGLQIN